MAIGHPSQIESKLWLVAVEVVALVEVVVVVIRIRLIVKVVVGCR